MLAKNVREGSMITSGLGVQLLATSVFTNFGVRCLQKTHWAVSCRPCSQFLKLLSIGWLVWVHQTQPFDFESLWRYSLKQMPCSDMTSAKERAACTWLTTAEANPLVPSRPWSSMRLCYFPGTFCRQQRHHSPCLAT